MATKEKKSTNKTKKTSVAKKVNTSLVNASMEAINATVDNGTEWQKLASKLIKKSEKVRQEQINMVFDTAEAMKGQFISGTDRMKNLVGYDAELVEKAKNMATKNPVSKKVMGIVEGITEKVSENPMVQKAEKVTEGIKSRGMAKFNELKGDVLEQASKIVNKAENKLEEAREELQKEAKKATKKAAKTDPKKTTAAIKAKVAAKEVSATKAKKIVAKKVSELDAKGKARVEEVKAEVKEAIKTSAKDDLKLIYGIGPKTEIALNNNGIKTYAEFEKLEVLEVESILEKEEIKFSNAEVKDWKKQAEVAVKEGSEGLVKWVERYRSA